MKISNVLKNKKIKVTEIPKWGIYLRKQWEDNFANHLSFEEKEKIYLWDNSGFCGYLWHLFSYEKRDCQQGQEAEKAFNNENKNSCYVFWQHTEDALILDSAGMLSSNDLEDEKDIYIVDKGFNWTYIKTHETGFCGPYFSRRDSKL